MNKGKILAILTRDSKAEIKLQIKKLETRKICQTWAQVERNRVENRVWVYQALAERAHELEGEP